MKNPTPAAAVTFAVTAAVLTGLAFAGFSRGLYELAAGVIIAAGLAVIADILFVSRYQGAHRKPREPRETPVAVAADALPASAEARTETFQMPTVAHEDTVAITAVVPAVKDEPTLLIPVAPKLGTVDVSRATREVVQEFLGPDLVACFLDGGVLIRGLAGDEITAHDGDRVGRDHEGVYVLCTEEDRPLRGKVAVHGWETNDLTEIIADLGRKEAVA